MDDSEIDGKGAEAVAGLLEGSSSLRGLNLSSNPLGNNGARSILRAVKTNKTLSELELRDLRCGDGARWKTSGMRCRPWQRTALWCIWDLSFNNIGPAGCRTIAEVLAANRSLARLNLNDNPFGDEGCTAIAMGVNVNTALSWLYLENTGIGDTGAIALGKALQSGAKVRVLELTSRQMTEKGLEALAEGLSENFYVVRLKYQFLAQAPHKGIEACIERNRTLYMQGAAKGFALEVIGLADAGPRISASLLDAGDARAAVNLGALSRATRDAAEKEVTDQDRS